MVRTDASLAGLTTLGTLQDGIAHALRAGRGGRGVAAASRAF
ncbi:Hypothetical protein CAP_5580 [Chondromyces apiculatus DSM 436]|uniref:Uncharacterized protein n=1 Tax=Chondromyces apiculatus DSM 436 TaxID=1192034 RepID=A0A017T308_9BACT|nr:Hypothetical protein CAP_5580 [Chondromyces apiculatus DSM 436]